MTDDSPFELLDSDWALPVRAESGHESDGRSAVGLVVSCPMAPRPSGRLWPLRPVDAVSQVQRLGGQTWEYADEARVLAPDLAHFAHPDELETILVVGHADCDAVETAHEASPAIDRSMSAGIQARVDVLVSLVREAIESGHVQTDCPPETRRARLVEYTVCRQVEFLHEIESVTATVAGYVHDDTGVYGGFPETTYLVSLNGEQDVETLRSRVPAERDVAVASVRN